MDGDFAFVCKMLIIEMSSSEISKHLQELIWKFYSFTNLDLILFIASLYVERHDLSQSKDGSFKSGSSDTYVIEELDLGELQKIR